jgi:hypothetical protein
MDLQVVNCLYVERCTVDEQIDITLNESSFMQFLAACAALFRTLSSPSVESAIPTNGLYFYPSILQPPGIEIEVNCQTEIRKVRCASSGYPSCELDDKLIGLGAGKTTFL